MHGSLHPEIKRLVNLVGEILPLVGIGDGATDSFWKERSLDCHFLEFGQEFKHWHEPRVRIEFYPGQTESENGIDRIEVIDEGNIWRVTPFMPGEIHHVSRIDPRFEHHFSVRDKKEDKAHLSCLEITQQAGGTVSYGTFYPDSDEWSHGTTSGYPWTEETPKTLKTANGILGEIFGKPIVPHVSLKERIDEIIKLGKFTEFKKQLQERKPAFAAA